MYQNSPISTRTCQLLLSAQLNIKPSEFPVQATFNFPTTTSMASLWRSEASSSWSAASSATRRAFNKPANLKVMTYTDFTGWVSLLGPFKWMDPGEHVDEQV